MERSSTHALDEAHPSYIQQNMSRMASLTLFLAGLGYFILTLAMPLINQAWHLSQKDLGLLGSSALFGAMIGALASGYLTDQLGRRTVLIMSITGVFFFSLLSALTWNIHSLILSRFLLGICISSNYPVAVSYLAETMPIKTRGRQFCQAMLVNCMGAVAGVIVSYLILCVYKEVSAWRLMLVLTCIPAVWGFFISLRIPKSPRLKMTGCSIDQTTDLHINKPAYADLFRSKFISQTCLVCLTWFLMDISYYGVGVFTPSLMQSLHMQTQGDFFSNILFISKETVFANIFIVIGAYCSVILIEHVGRIKLQSQGFLWMTIGLLILCASYLFISEPIMHLICILSGFAIFNFFINAGPSATTCLIPAEAYPTHLRGKGYGLASACSKMGAALGIFILPLLQKNLGTLITILIIAGTAFLGYIISLRVSLDTKDKTLEQSYADITKKKESFIPEVKFDPYIGF